MKKSLLVLLVVFFAVSQAFIFAGTQEEIIRLQSDILQLQEQIRLLQKVVDEKNSVIQTLLEQLNDQFATNNATFTEMVNAVNESRARNISLSENVSSVKTDVARLSTRLDEINSRLAEVQRKFDENQMQVQTLRSVPSSASGDVDVEPDRVYSASYNDYLVGNYALAINGLRRSLTAVLMMSVTDLEEMVAPVMASISLPALALPLTAFKAWPVDLSRNWLRQASVTILLPRPGVSF